MFAYSEKETGAEKFKSVKAGSSSLIFNGQTFIASDVRTIHYRNTDAQGELPFNLSGNQATGEVCDWRRGNLFLTLDYSTFPMDSYFGRIVSLDSLKLENKRSDDEIRESAGRLKGEIFSETAHIAALLSIGQVVLLLSFCVSLAAVV